VPQEERVLPLRKVLESAKNPAILCSFGKDSTVLLKMVREVRPETVIVYFKDRINPNAEHLIREWELTVLSYEPLNRYLVPWEEDICLVDEMTIGNEIVPLFRDVSMSECCDVERLSQVRTEFDWPFDITLWGYRKTDEMHPALQSPFAKDFRLGNTRMIAPLYDWTDGDIADALREIPFRAHSDAIGICQGCLGQLDDWDRGASLEMFTSRFGYARAA
jgi:3'-phosphoadenosine 5'-phosphosulfate sulfotransferase (PAPS reductase)/FAD synthetase